MNEGVKCADHSFNKSTRVVNYDGESRWMDSYFCQLFSFYTLIVMSSTLNVIGGNKTSIFLFKVEEYKDR